MYDALYEHGPLILIAVIFLTISFGICWVGLSDDWRQDWEMRKKRKKRQKAAKAKRQRAAA